MELNQFGVLDFHVKIAIIMIFVKVILFIKFVIILIKACLDENIAAEVKFHDIEHNQLFKFN